MCRVRVFSPRPFVSTSASTALATGGPQVKERADLEASLADEKERVAALAAAAHDEDLAVLAEVRGPRRARSGETSRTPRPCKDEACSPPMTCHSAVPLSKDTHTLQRDYGFAGFEGCRRWNHGMMIMRGFPMFC